jgi:hypothetical protein
MKLICKTCKYPKDEADFYVSKNKSGHESSCKTCSNLHHYERRRERRIEQGLVTKFPTLANRDIAAKGMKYCPGCKQIKSIVNDFSTMNVRNGIASHCKECTAEWGGKYYDTPQGKQAAQASYKRNREKIIDQKLKRKFGITLEEYNKMLDNQSGRCIICGRTPKQNGKMLAVDHDHSTGKNRDLLCNNCNVTIGFIEKNKIDTDNLKQYLNKHQINVTR